MAKILKYFILNKLYEDGIKSVNDTVIITPDARARLPAKILLLVFFKNIKMLPTIVERPAKDEIIKLYNIRFIISPVKYTK